MTFSPLIRRWFIAVFISMIALPTVGTGSRLDAAQRERQGSASTVKEKSSQGSPDQQPPNENLAQLSVLIGPWRLKETHFNSRGDVIGTMKGEETITWSLEQHALRREYKTFDDTIVYHAIGLITWSDAESQYRGAWFDNTSKSGPTLMSGQWSAESRSFVFTLEAKGAGGATLRYRRIEELVDEENRVATTFLLKGSDVIKVLEVRYERTIPCPTGIRPVVTEKLRSKG